MLEHRVTYICDRCGRSFGVNGIQGSFPCQRNPDCGGTARPDIKIPAEVEVEGKLLRLPKVKSIESGEGRRKGVWMVDSRSGKIAGVYMTCLVCGAINNVSDNRVDEDGNSQCFRCPKCNVYHCVRFNGITPEERGFMAAQGLRTEAFTPAMMAALEVLLGRRTGPFL